VKKPVNKKVKIIPGQNRLYRSPQIKLNAKKRSEVFESIPVINDEKKEKEPDVRDGKWEMHYLELKEFKKKYGHCHVPRSKKYLPLGAWCNQQRILKKYSQGKYQPERESKLNDIGFKWSLLDLKWEKWFERLKKFREKYGHCNVTKDKGLNNEILANWVRTQRIYYKGKHHFLTAGRIKKLNSIGFLWVAPPRPPQPLRISDRELLTDLNRLSKSLKRIPGNRDVCEHGKYCISSYYKRFGGIQNAREKAGLEKKRLPSRAKIREKELLNALKELYKKLNRTPTDDDITKYGKYGSTTYHNMFGSIMNARKKANLPERPVRPFKITEEELLDDLKHYVEIYKKIPTQRDINKHGKYSAHVYFKRFGSFVTAREKAGLEKP
jgi:Helicase associated domain/Homing endonuclease associated repeat